LIFDPSETLYYQERTKRVTQQPGITNPNRKCKGCGATGINFKKKRGTGSSRHNPAIWLCQTCHGKENKNG
jgi:hypothetical protein